MDSALHREMHRRGDCLTTTARTSIISRRDTLLEQQKTLENDISDKMEALRAVKAVISLDTALLAPIRSIPREILSYIFSLAREDYISVLHDDILIVIGQVCKLWRTLTRSTPTLWTDLRICISESSPRRAHLQMENIVQRACALSKRQPLDLTIDLPHILSRPQLENVSEVVGLITTNLSRLGSLDYLGSFRDLSQIIQKAKDSKTEFPGLKTLKLYCTHNGGHISQMDTRSAGFSSVSRLEIDFPPEMVTPSWINLTSFSGPFSDASSCYDFLANSPHLSCLNILHIPPENSSARSRSVLTLPNIQRLTIADCAIGQILDDLSLPHLKELTTECEDVIHDYLPDWRSPPCVATSQPALAIRNLIVRSGCSLRVLSIDDFMDFNHCIPLFELCSSSLTTLNLMFYVHIDSSFAPFFGALVTSNGSALLPHLSELSIKAVRGMMSSSSAISIGSWLDKVVRSRRDSGDVVNLSKLYLRTDEYSSPCSLHEGEFGDELAWHTSALAMTLLELEKEGLRVDWKRGIDKQDIMEHGRQFLATVS